MGGAIHVVYVLATTRSAPYCIDVATAADETAVLEVIRQTFMRYIREREVWQPVEAITDPALLVHYELQANEQAARARAAQIRRWPHAWQRRWIESHNPYWLEQWELRTGGPVWLWYTLPETTPATMPTRCGPPAGVPMAEVERLKALYNTMEWPLSPEPAPRPTRKQGLQIVR